MGISQIYSLIGVVVDYNEVLIALCCISPRIGDNDHRAILAYGLNYSTCNNSLLKKSQKRGLLARFSPRFMQLASLANRLFQQAAKPARVNRAAKIPNTIPTTMYTNKQPTFH